MRDKLINLHKNSVVAIYDKLIKKLKKKKLEGFMNLITLEEASVNGILLIYCR